jgi:hypothetical protein
MESRQLLSQQQSYYVSLNGLDAVLSPLISEIKGVMPWLSQFQRIVALYMTTSG